MIGLGIERYDLKRLIPCSIGNKEISCLIHSVGIGCSLSVSFFDELKVIKRYKSSVEIDVIDRS